jgi:acyl-CoA reductase-like NAD-dependent aldehyde dehydrogenase
MLLVGKIAPATAAGNCIIIKTSPFTPYSGIKLVELANQFFPPGVVQCLSDEGTLGPLMTTHPDIDKISFTGSTATGKKVAAAASGTMKRVTLECGGNDPAIICASIKNIPAVAAQVATFALLNSGQICLAIKRIYVHASIYDKFRDAVVAHVKNLKVGGGLEPDTFLGPIQNDMQYEKVRGFLHDVKADGLKVAFGGQEIPTTTSATGYYIHPTIVDNPPDTARIVTEEPFGPILPLLSWETEDEVVARANATDYGLGASIWSDNEEEAERIARKIESGTVWVNTHLDVSPLAPFGGHKQSGMGVEWGTSGLKAMSNSQTIHVNKGKL